MSLPARFVLRINEETPLTSLNYCLVWLRLLHFAVSASFLGLFANLYGGLPRGFVASRGVTIIFALATTAGVYPMIFPWLLLWYERLSTKVRCLRVSRATDALVLSPLLIALAVLLGDAGVPATCETLYEFDIYAYGKLPNSSIDACNPHARTNECGTGYGQRQDNSDLCESVKAGFALVILAIVIVYFIVATSGYYLYRISKIDPSLPMYSTSEQHLVSEIQRPGTAHVRSGNINGEPPPPYTVTVPTTNQIAPPPLETTPPLETISIPAMEAATTPP
ncbi:hypothetical protein EJ08DRAFT_657808 [Tothia fuscella]|uniref:MARVEL domain-containing protein n=1 Tax=Tothia fuscella TaxID=1048955 RepID=A0A9P4U0K4_9PEZI|nr:hypothetical protein EJ08DRAFT_657808 [Tothia fuscella]